MHFDDRLATVLRSDASGNGAARTQFRQLLDLLGSSRAEDAGLPMDAYRRLAAQADALSAEERERMFLRPALEQRHHRLLTFLAYYRLAELGKAIPAEERSRIMREPGLRLRNRRLVALLADGDPKLAAAAVATARLSEEDWLTLIPQLPVMARGFLRHRRDLPQSVRSLLEQMGVRDNVLPLPEALHLPESAILPAEEEGLLTEPAESEEQESKSGIRELRRRIEAFRDARKDGPKDPRLPLGDGLDGEAEELVEAFGFSLGTNGRIDWADDIVAPHLIGMKPGSARSGALATIGDAALHALAKRQVVRGAVMRIESSGPVSGDWIMDGVPQFSADVGAFTGYAGRLRRPVSAKPATTASGTGNDSQEDRMRQVLHELGTPVNAIQGFAEIIQQQIFGPVPNEYRAHAAAIAVDAAKLLAGFDEVDRLSKLESGAEALETGDGEGNMREVVAETVKRLDGALRARNSGFKLSVKGDGFHTGLDRRELLGVTWRIFASLAASLAPSETAKIKLSSDGETITMRCRLPASLAQSEDIMAAPVPEKRPAISAGMFGSGFSLRLARAEIQSAGGEFIVGEDRIVVNLPVLTGGDMTHSTVAGEDDAA